MDVKSLRSSIKSWEHTFKASNNRDPTVQDIKDNPRIADMYKLYKKLTKNTQEIPRSRPIATQPPAISINPFSPAKKNKAGPSSLASPRPNSFVTPTKHKLHPSIRSPSPLPATGDKTAFARARKRLRGEPVSPSPVKEKRLRLTPQAATISHPSRVPEDNLLTRDDDASFFIVDSPVKHATGTRAYIPLFQEASPIHTDPLIIPRANALRPGLVSRGKSRALSPDFGDEDADWVGDGKIKALDLSPQTSAPQRASTMRPFFKAPRQPNKLFRTSAPPSPPPSSNPPSDGSPQDQPPVLIPPSPPRDPSSKSNHPSYTSKSRAKPRKSIPSAANKKKAKSPYEPDIDNDTDDEVVEEGEPDVKVVEWRQFRGSHTNSTLPIIESGENWDTSPHLHPPAGITHTEDPGEVEVNLPEELQRVLAISADGSGLEGSAEEKMYKELVYGSREIQYNGKKGGEIWDVGEVATNPVANGEEDEWEGEPVPWEVGEL